MTDVELDRTGESMILPDVPCPRCGNYKAHLGCTAYGAQLDRVWPPTAVASAPAVTAQPSHDHMRIPDDLLRQSNVCLTCRQPIQIMIYRGSGWCSEQCRKALADE